MSQETTQSESASTRLLLRETMTTGMMRPIAFGTVAAFSTRCPGKSTDNEDAAALIEVGTSAAVLAVADGVGGHAAGAMAASLTVQAMADAVRAAEDPTNLRDAVLTGFENANRAVTDIGVGAATTLSAVELHPDGLRSYHVGDSPILLVSQRGRVRLQIISHSPVGYAVESGMLPEQEAMHHADRHVVSNLVGSDQMRIEISSRLNMQRRDTLLLASDGLFDNLHTREIVEIIRKGPLPKAADRLAELTLQRMSATGGDEPSKPDDLTFLIFRRSA